MLYKGQQREQRERKEGLLHEQILINTAYYQDFMKRQEMCLKNP